MPGWGKQNQTVIWSIRTPGRMLQGVLQLPLLYTGLAPTTQLTSLIPDLSLHASQDPESVSPVAHQQQDIEDSGELGDIHMGGLLEDTKFYQDAASEYQSAYKALRLQQEEL